ncbi:hypothetical protein BGZ65_013007, partial [Modicella reniformis]
QALLLKAIIKVVAKILADIELKLNIEVFPLLWHTSRPTSISSASSTWMLMSLLKSRQPSRLAIITNIDAKVLALVEAHVSGTKVDVDAIAIDVRALIELIVNELVVNVDADVLAEICVALQVAGLIDANADLHVSLGLDVDVWSRNFLKKKKTSIIKP